MAPQPDSPDITVYPYAIFSHVPLNRKIRYPTTDFLRREIRRVDSECLIESMTLLKGIEGKQHELVMVSLIAPPKKPGHPKLKRTIFFERRMDDGSCGYEQDDADVDEERVGNNSSTQIVGIHSAAVCPSLALSSSASSASMEMQNFAKDIIIVPSTGSENSGWERAFQVAFPEVAKPADCIRQIYTITFTVESDECPTLLDLAVVLDQVSSGYRKYNIFKFQCYFYSALVCETMGRLFRSEKTLGPAVEEHRILHRHVRDESRLEFRIPNGNMTTPEGRGSCAAGTYRSITIFNSTTPEFAEEVEKMRESFVAARQRKLEHLDHGQSLELQEAQQGKLDAERRLEEQKLRNEELTRELDLLKAQQSSGSHLSAAVWLRKCFSVAEWDHLRRQSGTDEAWIQFFSTTIFMPALSDLPLDLLPVIIAHVSHPNPKVLTNLCLVNKTFYELCLAQLYSRISIYSWHKHGKTKVIQLFDCLASHPHLAQHVRRLEIRDFPKALVGESGADQRRHVIQGLKNCTKLSSCTWTRDGSLDSDVLEALNHSSLKELEINGHNQGFYDPKILLRFHDLQKISVIMPSPAVVQTLSPWLERTGEALRNLTIICKSSPIITDETLELLSPNLRNLEYLYITGCPKVTHRGVFAVLSQSTQGLLGLGIEGLSPRFDIQAFRRECVQTGALSRLRSITLTVHQQVSLETWMRDVTDLLSSDVPLEMFQVYSTGAFFESPMTKQFWSDIVTAHQDRLIRFSVHRMLISLESIEDICKRCTKLEQLFVVVEPNSLARLSDCLSHANNLRTVHINYPLTDTTPSEIKPPVLSPAEALKIVDRCSPTISQFGCNARVWKVEREVVKDEDGQLVGIRRQIARYDSPDIPEAFLVVRT
ncbi:hypothetical protein VNI00_006692 [Paramarasmius palmivorus]|uniref:F-box domain-containing protein n=1 Tax=Paramarasmius palmivorus TaxID=297713 RepID=A0AAW0D562_9AGAR